MGAKFCPVNARFVRLSIKFLLFTGFFLVLFLFGVRRPESPAPRLAPPAASLRCSEVVSLGDWGWENHGGPRTASLDSREFFSRVVDRFADRLDPLRLWIHKAEISEFVSKNYVHWTAVLDGDCAALEEALLSWYRQGQERLSLYLSRSRLGFLPHRDVPAPAEPEDFPATSADAEARMEALARYHLTVASPALRSAFRGDTGLFLKSTFTQLSLPETVAPREWLAKAVLGGLDSYSTYFSPEEYREFEKELKGEVSGIGVRVRQVPAGYLVEAVLDDTPAQQAGIEAGEIVLSIDGVGIAEMPPREAGELFSGPSGSQITLRLSDGEGKQRRLTLVRRPFNLATGNIEGTIERGRNGSRVGILTVPSFYGGGYERSSAEDLRRVMEDLMRQGVDSMVLDMRGNPGGYLDEAVTMGSFFLGDEPVVAVVSRDNERVLRNSGKALYEGPLVVLLDEESASASEVLAGALKDHQRALLVGSDRTYGKGSVQKLFHLDDEFLAQTVDGLPSQGVVKLTTSLFYSPLGHSPANGGVETHVKLSPRRSPLPKSRPEWELRPFLDPSSLNRLNEIRPNWVHLASRLEEQTVTEEAIKEVWTPFWRPDGLGALEVEDNDGVKEAVAIASEIPSAKEWKEVRKKAPWRESSR